MRLLFWFGDLRLPIKFLLVAGFLSAGLLALGLNYQQTLSLNGQALARNNQLNTLSNLVDAVTINALEARNADKDFQLGKDPKQVDAFELSMGKVEEALNLISGQLRTEADRSVVDNIQQHLNRYQDDFHRSATAKTNDPQQGQWRMGMEATIAALSPLMERFYQIKQNYQAEDNAAYGQQQQAMLDRFSLAVAAILVILVLASFIIRYGVLRPVATLHETIRRLADGDMAARSHIHSRDELGRLASTLNRLLDERIQALTDKERENAELNRSIVALLENLFRLGERDLTVRVPVAADVTGVVSDSVNRLAESFAGVLQGVRQVANDVAETSLSVKTQASDVMAAAHLEQQEIAQTLIGLNQAVTALHSIFGLAQNAGAISQETIHSTEVATLSVNQTLASINKIRTTIQEAEKKIKRLGERSQEIGGIVKLLDNFSERTHILSLNASMQASSAGIAGKGLMVVVDEVQRLAENSREAAADIEGLVNNIQLETADTMQAINTVIGDVVVGTQLAQQAGDTMQTTRSNTESLVNAVAHIARQASEQTEVAEQLRFRAVSIDASASATNTKMHQQTQLSETLVSAAALLQTAIAQFKLAEA